MRRPVRVDGLLLFGFLGLGVTEAQRGMFWFQYGGELFRSFAETAAHLIHWLPLILALTGLATLLWRRSPRPWLWLCSAWWLLLGGRELAGYANRDAVWLYTPYPAMLGVLIAVVTLTWLLTKRSASN